MVAYNLGLYMYKLTIIYVWEVSHFLSKWVISRPFGSKMEKIILEIDPLEYCEIGKIVY
jgi:hypothetical protein